MLVVSQATDNGFKPDSLGLPCLFSHEVYSYAGIANFY